MFEKGLVDRLICLGENYLLNIQYLISVVLGDLFGVMVHSFWFGTFKIFSWSFFGAVLLCFGMGKLLAPKHLGNEYLV